MNSHHDLEDGLRRLGEKLPPSTSLVDSVMQRTEHSTVSRSHNQQRVWFVRSSIAVAAAVLLAAGVWFATGFWTPELSLAQVASSVAKQKWLHVKYDNGRERWTSLYDGKSYHKDTEGRITFIDQPKNLRLTYWPGSGCVYQSTLYESRETPPQWKPKSLEQIVGVSMDMPAGRAGDERKDQVAYTERHIDTINGRRLARFDQYVRDALGQHQCLRRVWVDPHTLLPFRIQSRLQPGQRDKPNQKYVTGHYDFPTEGPASIYELGVPRDVPIVRIPEKLADDIAEVIDVAKSFKDRFPSRYRMIVWPDRDGAITIIHRDGAPVRKTRRGESDWVDWRDVKIRHDHYFNLDEQHAAYHLPLPATWEQVLAWTQTQTPGQFYLSDGERAVAKHGPYPPPVRLGATWLRVLPVRGRLWFPEWSDPSEEFWPFVDVAGPFALVVDDGQATAGNIVIRREAGNSRRDFYLDPKRDYICTRWIWWEKRSGQWVKDREYELSDFQQLPEGQWYARRRHMHSFGSPERGTGPSESTLNIRFQILDEGGFPPDVFNGAKLLDAARQEGIRIETD